METLTITVPGAVWYDALDPMASDAQSELELPEPVTQKVGRGWQAVYSGLTREVAEELAEYLTERGELFLRQPGQDPEVRSVSRAMVETGERIRAVVAAAGEVS